MTAPLDEKALAEARTSFEMENSLERAIRAYLAASPSPSEMEVGKLLWRAEETRADLLTHHRKEAEVVGELADALSSAQSALAAMAAQRDEAKGRLALIVDRIVYSDSYGVPGSDFQCCHLCNGGGAPGVPFEHDKQCPVRQVERDYEQWFDDIRATEDALRETEERASAAESQVLRLTEENEALERHNQALLDKVSSEDCACAYDGPDDVCLGHSPKLRAAEARIKALEDALSHALDHYDRNICLHESVHRGGSIWTICDDCGRQWADDKGGFQPHVDPTEISAARTTLQKEQTE